MSKQYDLDSDNPYGVASADFPVTFYDRPQLMFGNLLQGDIDGMTRAMLSPSSLTPSQMKKVRDILMPGRKTNPILGTILDIATNPLVIIGLAVGLWKFPLGSTKSLLDLRKGLLPKVAAMGPMASKLHDAMMNLRHVPGLFENVLGITRETTEFASKHWNKVDDIFRQAGPLTKAESLLVAARLDGLHKVEHYMVKALRNEPEWKAFMGGGDIPIALNIQNSMSPRLIKLSDQLRGWYNSVRSELMDNPEVKQRIKNAVEKKGLRFGEDVIDYFPHQGNFNKYYQQSLRGATGVQYRKWLHQEVAEKVGREEIQRLGGMFANIDDLKLLEETGAIRRGFSNTVQTIITRQSAEAGQVVGGIWDDILKLGLDDAQQRVEFVRRMRDYYTKGAGKHLDFVGRLGNKRKVADTLDAMAGALQDARFAGTDAVQKELLEIGRVLAEPANYSLNPFEATGRYINSVASSYAWHGTGLGKQVMDTIAKPGIFREAPHLESYLLDDILPHIQGLKTFQQMTRSLNYSVRKEKIFNWLKNNPMIDDVVGSDRKKWLLDYFGKAKSLSSSEAMGAAISHHFYLTALGANLSSSSKNMLQSFVTTINTPGIGLRGMWYGLKGFGGEEGLLVKMERYLSHIGGGMKPTEAFNQAFPEFVKDAGNASKIVDAMLAGDIAREGYARVVQKGVIESAKKILMAPFAMSEAGNRLLAYYSGRNAHLFHNASKLMKASAGEKAALLAEAGSVGQTLNMFANFTGGPLGLPRALINMAPQWRQFMHFPLRFMGFLHGSMRLGIDPNKLDWGTMGRALAGSTTMYLVARNLLKTDISGGLLTGALPLPQYEKAPFYPWPLVPPIAQIGGATVKAVMSGDLSGLGDVGALLVPGGIAGRRAYKSLSPRFADYRNPTPDGRISLYNNEGALISNMTPMELSLRAIGLRPASLSAEAGAAKWLLGQRDRIRGYRREYTQALFENDTGRAEKINQEFQRIYPELGPLQIKKSDIRALENRREISRLHRISRGISKDYRPLFEQVIGEASLGRLTEDIQTSGMDVLQNYLPPQ
jgi:hypothetical protein